MTIKQIDIIRQVAAAGIPATDTPAIREALNMAMDTAERAGWLSRKVADGWNQAHMVKRVRAIIRGAK